jgi:anthranilate phosphoribosyltransferase
VFIAGRAASVREGIALAAEAIDSGRAQEVLTRLAAASHVDGGAPA